MTPVFCCGFECGASLSSSHWPAFSAGGGVGFDATVGKVRSGARSLLFSPSGIIAAAGSSPLTAGTRFIIRAYIRFTSLPTADVYLIRLGSSTGGPAVRFKQSDSKIYASVGTTLGSTGVNVTTGQWYRIDCDFNVNTGGNDTSDAQVDGVACGQASASGFTTTQTEFRLGHDAAWTANLNFDDVICSQTGADYPIGAGHIDHFIPVSDGIHNIAGTGDFSHGTAGADILNTTTDAWALISKVPFPSTPDTANLIAAVSPANPTSDYVECKFGPASGISTPTVGPRGVEWILAYHQAATQTGQSQVKIRCVSATNTVFDTGAAAGVTTLRYARGHLATAPGGSAWNVTPATAGNFNDLYCRFLGPDAAPDQYLDAIMIEAEFQDDTSTPINVNENGAGTEAVSVSANIPISETGAGTDTSSVDTGVQNINASQTGAGTDSVLISVDIPVSQTGAGTEQSSVISNLSAIESAPGTEISSFSSNVTANEINPGTQSAFIQSSITVSEGLAGDAIQISANLSSNESSPGTDFSVPTGQTTVSESSPGAEGIAIDRFTFSNEVSPGTESTSIFVSLSIGQIGAGTDSASAIESGNDVLAEETSIPDSLASTSGIIPIAESFAGAEATTVQVNLSVSETGVLSDSSSIQSLISATEGISSTEITQVVANVSAGETGIGIDFASVQIPNEANVSEGVPGSESVSINVQITLADSGAGSDSSVSQPIIIPSETGAGNQSTSITVQISFGEVGVGSESISIVSQIVSGESGFGTDSAITFSNISFGEVGVGSELVQTLANVSVGESGVGTDSAQVQIPNEAGVAQTGAGIDAVTITVLVSSGEIGVGTDVGESVNQISISEGIPGTDSSLMEHSRLITENAPGFDEYGIVSNLFVSEGSPGFDESVNLGTITVQEIGLDSGLFVYVANIFADQLGAGRDFSEFHILGTLTIAGKLKMTVINSGQTSAKVTQSNSTKFFVVDNGQKYFEVKDG